MPIPIAKDQTQFNVPTAQGGPDNAGRMIDMNVGLPEAGENLFKATEGAATLLGKMRVESDMAKASNDYLAYKKGMNDLLYSPELDENGEPIGFIYKTGEQAFNSLKDYDAKSSALYQEFTKKLGQYLPVATENAFKSANDFNEGFRNMMMKHATQENEKFKEESLNNYIADTIATVESGMLGYNDNAMAFFDSKSAEMDHRIMQYYIAKGFPQKGRELYMQKNYELLEATLQQVALNNSNSDSFFGGYDEGEALLNHVIDMNKQKGTEVVPTKKIKDLGRMFALRQFDDAFYYSKNFDKATFDKRLQGSKLLDKKDKDKYQAEYDEKFSKSRKSGLDQSTSDIIKWIKEVHNRDHENNGFYNADLGVIGDFLYMLSVDDYSFTKKELTDPKTNKVITDKDGNPVPVYGIVFNNKDFQKRINDLGEGEKHVLKKFITNFAEGKWVIPDIKGMGKIAKLANDYKNQGVFGEQRENLDVQARVNKYKNAQNLMNLYNRSSVHYSVVKNDKGEDQVVPTLDMSNYGNMLFALKNLEQDYKNRNINDDDYKELHAVITNDIAQIDEAQLNNEQNIVKNKGLFGFVSNAWHSFSTKISDASTFRTFTEKGTHGWTRGIFGLMAVANRMNPMYEEIDPNDRRNLKGPSQNTSQVNIRTHNALVNDLKNYNAYRQKGGIAYKSETLMQVRNDLQYKLSTEGGLLLDTGLNEYVSYMGQLTPEDWKVFDATFFAKTAQENGWKDEEAVDLFADLVEKNQQEMIAKYRDHVASELVKNKPNGLYTYDSLHDKWNQLNKDIPNYNRFMNQVNYQMPVTFQPLDLNSNKTLKNQIIGAYDSAAKTARKTYAYGKTIIPTSLGLRTPQEAVMSAINNPYVIQSALEKKKAPTKGLKGNTNTMDALDNTLHIRRAKQVYADNKSGRFE